MSGISELSDSENTKLSDPQLRCYHNYDVHEEDEISVKGTGVATIRYVWGNRTVALNPDGSGHDDYDSWEAPRELTEEEQKYLDGLTLSLIHI